MAGGNTGTSRKVQYSYADGSVNQVRLSERDLSELTRVELELRHRRRHR
jgi:hypothetical protein